MSHISDAIGSTAHSQIEDLAAKHSSFEAFMQDMERLAEKAWHNSKSHAEVNGQQSLGDEEPAAASSGTIENIDDLKPAGEQDEDENRGPNTAVQPASPQSESGFPTSNVETPGESRAV
jgi:hypothetical protein